MIYEKNPSFLTAVSGYEILDKYFSFDFNKDNDDIGIIAIF